MGMGAQAWRAGRARPILGSRAAMGARLRDRTPHGNTSAATCFRPLIPFRLHGHGCTSLEGRPCTLYPGQVDFPRWPPQGTRGTAARMATAPFCHYFQLKAAQVPCSVPYSLAEVSKYARGICLLAAPGHQGHRYYVVL